MVDADWHAFCQALHQSIEGEDWEQLHDSYKAMSRAVGMKKPQEAQKAKALYRTRLALWEEHLKDPIAALDEALKCVGGVLLRLIFGSSAWWRERSPKWPVLASSKVHACGSVVKLF